ncbi:MAG: silent information regulator protein Sir2, NAD-dependent deacetylase [Candidatus Dadabacteria bacterium CSP1-2]|nr:MAG: silent information regulator protein Sir2, NAD-dependent deacetylase [Candidatus Dadabacteria bacterium CSP1-2]
MEDKIKEAKAIIDNASSITVLTGAGISAESGIPTFRGEDGLWRKFRSEELATQEAFQRDPKLVWEWYDWRRGLVKEAMPNPGHYALVNLENEKTNFTLVTQNIDGLHQLTGNRNIIEMHGNLWQIRCTSCGVVEENHDVPLKEIHPKCKNCDALGRPNVVWFGEMIPMPIIDNILIAIDKCQVMLIVGTSGIVEPAASMGLVAKHTGKTVIEVNLETTPNSSHYDISILGKSGEILPMLCSGV